MSKNRLLYIDNLRLLMIIMVVIQHLAITYCSRAEWAEWYYIEFAPIGFFQTAFFGFFLSFTQGYFMGLMFLIAGYFVPASYDKKGFGKFIKDRLVRLGIPVLVFVFLITPFILICILRYPIDMVFKLYFGTLFILQGTGPLWFALALLIFSIVYALIRKFIMPNVKITDKDFPSHIKMIGLILLLGACTFLVRIVQPVGTTHAIAGMKIGNFCQYIIMFRIGILCKRNQWFEKLDYARVKPWIVITVFPFAFISWAAFMHFGGAYDNFIVFSGGVTWQSAAFSLWESYVSVSTSVSLIAFFKEKFNKQNKLIKFMSENAFSVYVFHTPIILGLMLLFAPVNFLPIIKFAMLIPISIIVCFLFTHFTIRKIPFLRKLFM